MGGGSEKAATAVLACTPDNLADVRAAVRRWPELAALIGDLRAQGLFPGLRNIEFRLYGAPEWVAKGLDAIGAENAPSAPLAPAAPASGVEG
ncbi:MAG: hypothetical protein ACK5LJ_14655 [Paracoccus sp. (in: a-proteobacteria)]